MVVRAFRNIGHDVNEPLTRVYATPLAQPIHTDSADMVALLSLRLGKEGGLSSWSSSVSVHNELLRLGRKVSLSTHIPCYHVLAILASLQLRASSGKVIAVVYSIMGSYLSVSH